MIVDCISDLHGYEPVLQGGDLLIIAGDMTASNEIVQWVDFFNWLRAQEYEKKIIIGGNHDGFLEQCASTQEVELMDLEWGDECTYLRDDGCEFGGLKIWGSPWTAWFYGINPHCKSFTKTGDQNLKPKWDLIPDDTDILVTHSPPAGIMDVTKAGINVGSASLRVKVQKIRPKLHVFGHIHEQYGQESLNETLFVNASFVDGDYEAVNDPVRVIL